MFPLPVSVCVLGFSRESIYLSLSLSPGLTLFHHIIKKRLLLLSSIQRDLWLVIKVVCVHTMHPLLPFSLKESNLRSSPSLPTPSIESSLASNFTFASSGSFSSSLTPKTPPNSLLLDLDPPKAASSAPTTTTTSPTSPCNNAYGQSASSSCAYPSWPNRPSLVSTQTSMSTTTTATTTSTFSTASSSAFISDEELLDTTPLSSPAIEVDQDPCAAAGSTSMTIGSISMSAELRIRHMREQAEEEEDRSRFLAQVQAHARAQLATRMQLPPQQQQQQQQQQQGGGNGALALRTKQRKAIVPVVGKKRRATSSSSKKGYPRV